MESQVYGGDLVAPLPRSGESPTHFSGSPAIRAIVAKENNRCWEFNEPTSPSATERTHLRAFSLRWRRRWRRRTFVVTMTATSTTRRMRASAGVRNSGARRFHRHTTWFSVHTESRVSGAIQVAEATFVLRIIIFEFSNVYFYCSFLRIFSTLESVSHVKNKTRVIHYRHKRRMYVFVFSLLLSPTTPLQENHSAVRVVSITKSPWCSDYYYSRHVVGDRLNRTQ